MKKITFSIAALLLATSLHASDKQFQKASEVSVQELLSAQKQYNQTIVRISDERMPLAAELNELEAEAKQLREEKKEVLSKADTVTYSLDILKDKVKKLEDTNAYMTNLLNDYANRFNTQINQAEIPVYSDIINDALTSKESGDDLVEQFKTQMIVLKTSFARLNKVIGGCILDGDATLESGEKISGSFAVLGPISYFYSANKDAAGLAYMIAGSDTPHVYDLPSSKEGIKSLTSKGEGSVAVDASLGEAQEFENEQDTLGEEIAKGGFVMYPILGLAGICVIIIIIKLVQFLGVKEARQKDLETIIGALRDGRKDDAVAYAKRVKGPVGELLQVAVNNCDQDKEVIEEMLYEVIINNQPKMERMLTFIAVTAAVAPLFGLLGTVTGMIRTFKMITVVGTGDAGSLSGGISEALITTKWGLIIAIPTLLFHAMLSRTARGVIGSMEQAAVGFINGISDDE